MASACSGLTVAAPNSHSPVSVLLARRVSIGGVKANLDAHFLQLLLHLLCCSHYCCLLICLLVPEDGHNDDLQQIFRFTCTLVAEAAEPGWYMSQDPPGLIAMYNWHEDKQEAIDECDSTSVCRVQKEASLWTAYHPLANRQEVFANGWYAVAIMVNFWSDVRMCHLHISFRPCAYLLSLRGIWLLLAALLLLLSFLSGLLMRLWA